MVRALSSLVLIAALASPPVHAAELPTSVEVAGKTLQLNGRSTFKKWFFSVYDVGLYLEAKTQDPAKVLAAEGPKRLHLHLLRDAPKDQMINILRWRLQTVTGAEYEKIRERTDKLLGAITEAKKGANLLITWVPARGTVLTSTDGRELVIEGKDFSDALFRVWLDDKRIRPGLMKG